MEIKKTIKFSVEYTTEITVDENDNIDSNIDIEIPSGQYCGCNYVENSFKVISSNNSKIKKGDKVYHKNYGIGIVTDINQLDSLHGNARSIIMDNRHSDYELNFKKI